MNNRPVVLVLVACYLPGYKGGGPIRTVSNMADQLGDAYDFRIVTADHDHGDKSPYEGVRPNQWSRVGNAEVYYASREHQTLLGFAGLMRHVPHDLLYLNSLFSPRFSLLPLVVRRLGLAPRRPAVLAPRGELDEGALALKSVKKKVFLSVAHVVGLYKDVLWQASSDHEAQRIIEVMQVDPGEVFVAPNLPAEPLGRASAKKSSVTERLTIVFLSRIARKKNLDFALRVLSQVRAQLDFLIYGTTEDSAYWEECQKLIAAAPSNVHISYKGELPHERLHEALMQADLFFLPTRGENYGHVVLEALGAGVPVLISDRTPWNDVHDRGAGWSFPLEDIDSFVAVIEEYASEPQTVRDSRSERAYEYAAEVTHADDAIQANDRLFKAALANARQQDTRGN